MLSCFPTSSSIVTKNLPKIGSSACILIPTDWRGSVFFQKMHVFTHYSNAGPKSGLMLKEKYEGRFDLWIWNFHELSWELLLELVMAGSSRNSNSPNVSRSTRTPLFLLGGPFFQITAAYLRTCLYGFLIWGLRKLDFRSNPWDRL